MSDDNGVVVACYEGAEEWSSLGAKINEKTDNLLTKSFKLSDNKGKLGDSLVLYNVADYQRVAIVGLGKKPQQADDQSPSAIFDKFETARRASGTGVKALKARGATKIQVDCSFGDAKSCAEGANLGIFKFDLKSSATSKPSAPVEITPLDAAHSAQWTEGQLLASAQNFARELADMPSNLMTPTIFVESVAKQFAKLIEDGTVKMVVREEQWAREQKMGMFLGVTKGSNEPPKFLELHYKGAADSNAQPLIFVGKGVTFDSGGISIKPAASMGLMRGDMEGAATAVSALFGIASLKLPINVITLTPLCENMPSGHATKPGDVLTAMNGKTVEVDNTDAEGRLILGDALHYAHSFNPSTIVDIATLTGAIDVALGSHFAGAFSSSDELWDEINTSSNLAGDRMWRMPLLPDRKQLDSRIADMVNSAGRSGGACTAAMFLKEFVQINRWAHLDIAGVMYSTEEGPYIGKGMSGKPTRSLVELARSLSKKN